MRNSRRRSGATCRPGPPPRAVVLAASGGDLGGLTADRPKCMIDVRGQALLDVCVAHPPRERRRGLTSCAATARRRCGPKAPEMVDNDRYAETGEVSSLACAEEAIRGETVVAYGDGLFRRYILDTLLASTADIVLAVDALGPARRPVRRACRPRAPRTGASPGTTSTTILRTCFASVRRHSIRRGLRRMDRPGSIQRTRCRLATARRSRVMKGEGLLETADLPLAPDPARGAPPGEVHLLHGPLARRRYARRPRRGAQLRLA